MKSYEVPERPSTLSLSTCGAGSRAVSVSPVDNLSIPQKNLVGPLRIQASCLQVGIQDLDVTLEFCGGNTLARRAIKFHTAWNVDSWRGLL